MVAASYHYWYEMYRKVGTDAFIRSDMRDDWERYLAYVDAMETPPDRRFQQIHDGHCTYLVPEERSFITPAAIRASGGLVGEPDQIAERLRELEAAGLREGTLLPPMACARESFRDFADLVMKHYH